MIRCRISRLMGERKVRVADVARATGLHRNTVTMLYWETAERVDLETLDRLCRYFECGVAELLERDDQAAHELQGSLPKKDATPTVARHDCAETEAP